MANDLDKQIRIKIGERIEEPYPTAKVYTWNVLPRKISDWPGLFRVSDSVVHGWVIVRSQMGSEWKSPGRDRRLWTYDILGFYLFAVGNRANNSDNEFAEIFDTVYESIKDEPRLDFDGTVEKHGLLQCTRNTLINTGEETLHFAQNRLQVMLCC